MMTAVTVNTYIAKVVIICILSVILLIPGLVFESINIYYNEIFINGPIAILVSSIIVIKYVKIKVSQRG
ncbi:MAG: hypothetical protein E7204_00875 [Veillonella sp.]|uniref:hypothetical protein n=1 Tax=Veillonella sp. TaxID=1926307 RepID=UPI0025E9D3DA|nr:hypothetical protein [Veillonella sp.]MBE6079400.1 hypothetical protein [Veillonella sp.]